MPPTSSNPAMEAQDTVLNTSLSDPTTFWSHQASQLTWSTPPSSTLTQTTKHLPGLQVSHPHWTWFPDGEISTTYNCVDRHVDAGHGEDVAIIWDSPVTGGKERWTYAQVREETQVLAGVLREEGVRRGDVVLVYSMFCSALLRWSKGNADVRVQCR